MLGVRVESGSNDCGDIYLVQTARDLTLRRNTSGSFAVRQSTNLVEEPLVVPTLRYIIS
jgi:hypothetical protein